MRAQNGGNADDIKRWEKHRSEANADVRKEAAELEGATPGRLKPDHKYELNGYRYTTDAKGRITKVEGELRLESAPRSSSAQSRVGKNDGRLEVDQGGHLIGAQFGGYRGVENLTPMHKLVNNYHSGDWGKMEKNWAKALGERKSVRVQVDIQYSDDSMRASKFFVTEWINGKPSKHQIPNIQ